MSRPLKTWQWMSTSSVEDSGARLASSLPAPARTPRRVPDGWLVLFLAGFPPFAFLPAMDRPPPAPGPYLRDEILRVTCDAFSSDTFGAFDFRATRQGEP